MMSGQSTKQQTTSNPLRQSPLIPNDVRLSDPDHADCHFWGSIPSVEDYMRWPSELLPRIQAEHDLRKAAWEKQCTIQPALITNLQTAPPVTGTSAKLSALETTLGTHQASLDTGEGRIADLKQALSRARLKVQELQNEIQSITQTNQTTRKNIQLIQEEKQKLKKQQDDELLTQKTQVKTFKPINSRYCIFLGQLLEAESKYLDRFPTAKTIDLKSNRKSIPTSSSNNKRAPVTPMGIVQTSRILKTDSPNNKANNKRKM